MKWKKVFFLMLVIFVLLLSGCGNNIAETEELKDESEIIVGFSMATLLEDRWIQDRDLFMSKAQQQGITVIVKNANKDSDVQYQQVCDMLDQGIDILMISPNDSKEGAKCVAAAKAKGVPVISYDRLTFDCDVDVFISFDNEQVGVLMAEYLLEKVPEGGYLIVNGDPSDYNCTMIRDGFFSIFHSDQYEDAVLLEETWAEGWVREEAFEFVALSAEKYTDEIKAIVGGNDSLAWGAIDALSEAGMADDVVVVGMDADLVACQRIVQGKQGMTVYKPISDLVDRAVEVCIQLANGEKITASKHIDNGYGEIPYIPIDVIGVTIDNMDEVIIDGGFHLKEEIYN